MLDPCTPFRCSEAIGDMQNLRRSLILHLAFTMKLPTRPQFAKPFAMALIANVVQRPGNSHLISQRSRWGFTLVEMLITMALIIILFVMLYGKSSRRFQHEQKQACQQNLQNIYVALQLYANDTGGLFPIRKEAKTSEQALNLLLPRYTTVTAPFICPGTKGSPLPEGESFEKRRISYSYYMGRRATDSAEPLMS